MSDDVFIPLLTFYEPGDMGRRSKALTNFVMSQKHGKVQYEAERDAGVSEIAKLIQEKVFEEIAMNAVYRNGRYDA
jgi:hypothetical protein